MKRAKDYAVKDTNIETPYPFRLRIKNLKMKIQNHIRKK
jgi:hypothetical protein